MARILPKELASYYAQQREHHNELVEWGRYGEKEQEPSVTCYFSGTFSREEGCVVQGVYNSLYFREEDEYYHNQKPSRPVPLGGYIEEGIVIAEASALLKEIIKFFSDVGRRGGGGGGWKFSITEPKSTLELYFLYDGGNFTNEKEASVEISWTYEMDFFYALKKG